MARFMIAASRKTKSYRKIFDPLAELNDKELYSRFRFDKNGIIYLSDMLRNDLQSVTAKSRAIPVEIQVCIALRYLSSNDFQIGVADDFHISQPEVSLIVTRFIDAIVRHVDDFVKFPSSRDASRHAQSEFYQIAGFPRVVGCLDCTHVRILAPGEDENDYVNRKGYHSINVQAVCDANGKFINFSAKWPGSTHDSFILRNSSLWDYCEAGRLDGIILGDSGYPNRKWLFTPYRNPQTDAQTVYNSKHKRTRVLIENAFGRLKRRFAILHSEARLNSEKVAKVVAACIILHNIAIDIRLQDLSDVEIDDQETDLPPVGSFPLNSSAYRDAFTNDVFG